MKYMIFCIAFTFACVPLMADWGETPLSEPCLPDCDTNTFEPPFPDTAYVDIVTLDCGKDVEVYYRTRFACGMYYDIYIEYIEFVATGKSSYLNAYDCGQTMTTAEMLADAAAKLMILNPMNWAPSQNGECNYIWRVMKGSCWDTNFPTQSPSGGLVEQESNQNKTKYNSTQSPPLPSLGQIFYCNEQECCLEAYNVCMENGERTATFIPEASENPVCIDPACEPVCGTIYSR